MLRKTPKVYIKVFGIDLPRMSALGSADHNRRAVVAHLTHNKYIVPELFVLNRRSINGRRRGNLKQHRLANGFVPGASSCHIDEYCAAPTLSAMRLVAHASESDCGGDATLLTSHDTVVDGKYDKCNFPKSKLDLSEKEKKAVGEDKIHQNDGDSSITGISEDNPSSTTPSTTCVDTCKAAYRSELRSGTLLGKKKGSIARSVILGAGRRRGARCSGSLIVEKQTTAGGGEQSSDGQVQTQREDTVQLGQTDMEAPLTVADLPSRPITASPSLAQPGSLQQSLSNTNTSQLVTLSATNASQIAEIGLLLTPAIAESIVAVVDRSSPVERGWLYGGGGGRMASAGAAALGFHCLTRCSYSDNVIHEIDKNGSIVNKNYVCAEAQKSSIYSESQSTVNPQQEVEHKKGTDISNKSREEIHNSVSPTTSTPLDLDHTVSDSSSPAACVPRHAEVPQHLERILKFTMNHINQWALRGGEGGAEATRQKMQRSEEDERRREGLLPPAPKKKQQWRERLGGDLASTNLSRKFTSTDSSSSSSASASALSNTALTFDLKLPAKLIDLLCPTPLLEILFCAAVASIVEGRGAFVAVKEVDPMSAIEPRVQEAKPMNTVDSFIRGLSVSATLIRKQKPREENRNTSTNSPRDHHLSSNEKEKQQNAAVVLKVALHHDQHLRHLFELIGESAVVDLRLLRAHVGSEDYFHELQSYYSARQQQEEKGRRGGSSVFSPPSLIQKPSSAVVSLTVAWPEERLIKIGSVFDTVMRYQNKESLEMRRRGAAKTTAPMKRRAVRTLAAWWLGLGQELGQWHRAGMGSSSSPFATFPALPNTVETATAHLQQELPHVNGEMNPTSSLYFGACRRLRVCGDKDFMFVHMCRHNHGGSVDMMGGIDDTNTNAIAPLDIRKQSIDELRGIAQNAFWSTLRLAVHARGQQPQPVFANHTSNNNNNNKKAQLAFVEEIADSTSACVECVLEKRGLSHEYIVEEMLSALADKREERLVRLLTSVATEAIVADTIAKKRRRQDDDSPDSETANTFWMNKITEDMQLQAEDAARRFFERNIKPSLPKIVCSVTAIIEAPSHSFQRLRIRGSSIADITEFAGTLTGGGGGGTFSIGDDAESNEEGLARAALSAGGGGHATSFAGSSRDTLPSTSSIAAKMIVGTAAAEAEAEEVERKRTSDHNINKEIMGSSSALGVESGDQRGSELRLQQANHSSGLLTTSANILPKNKDKQQFIDSKAAPVTTIAAPRSSTSSVAFIASTSASAAASATSIAAASVAPLPLLLSDRVENANFLLNFFMTNDGNVIAGRLTPFGEDESLEGKRINITTAMGRFKRNVYGKSFHQRNVDGVGATTQDAEAAAFWNEHFYRLHNVCVIHSCSSVTSSSDSSSSTAVAIQENNNQQRRNKQRIHHDKQIMNQATNHQTLIRSFRALLLSRDAETAKNTDLKIGGLTGYEYRVVLRNVLPSQLPLVQFAVRRAAGAACVEYTSVFESFRALDRYNRAEQRMKLNLLSSSENRTNRREGGDHDLPSIASHLAVPTPKFKSTVLLTASNKQLPEKEAALTFSAGVEDGRKETRTLSNATGFLNYFAMNRFSWYSRANSHPGLHLLKGEFATAMEVLAPSSGDGGHDDSLLAIRRKNDGRHQQVADEELNGIAPRGGLDPRSRRIRALQKGENKIARIVRKAKMDAGIVAETDEGCRDLFINVISPKICQLLINEFLSFVWNETLSQRVRRYGRRTILVGDLVRPRDPRTGNPIVFSSLSSSGPTFATAEDILRGAYTYRDVVMPIPGAGVLLPRHDGLIQIYKATMERYGISMNSEKGTWDVFFGGRATASAGYPLPKAEKTPITIAKPLGPNQLGLYVRGGYRYAYELPRAFHCKIVPDDTFGETMKNLLTVKREIDNSARVLGADVEALEKELLTDRSTKQPSSTSRHRVRFGGSLPKIAGENQRHKARGETTQTISRAYRQLSQRLAALPLKATLSFQLPASAYAPMLIRELTRYPNTDLRDVMSLRKHFSTTDAALSGETAMREPYLSAQDQQIKKRWLTRRGRRSTEMGRALMIATLRKQILRPGGERAKMIGSMRSMDSYGLAVD